MSKIGFIFDLDGVITDTAKYHFEAWKFMADKLGIHIDEKFNEQLKGISRMDSLEKILVYGGKAAQFNQREKVLLADEKNSYYVKLLQGLGPNDLLPGVKQFLIAAKMRNIPCAIASASKNAPFILEKLAVKEYFAEISDPEKISQGKPDPEIFIRAAELLGVQPENVIAFEDAEAGIQAIKSAGMIGIGLSASASLIGADKVIQSFLELNMDDLLEEYLTSTKN